MHRRIEQWRQLERWEQWTLVKLCLLLPGVGLSLRIVGFKGAVRILSALLPATDISPPDKNALTRAHHLGRLVDIAARYGIYRATCLRRTLALWCLLRRRGVPAEIRVGVRKSDNTIAAHAWVELAGAVVYQAGDSVDAYMPFSASRARPLTLDANSSGIVSPLS